MNIPADAKPIQTPVAPGKNGWNFFDRIYCISLSRRADRREQATAEFCRVGLNGLVEFLIVEKDPANSERGIFDSHIKALSAGLAANAQTILLFEDDIVFDRFSITTLDAAVNFMRTDVDWHAFFFGCFVKSSRRTDYPGVLHVRYRSTMHAYAITRSFAKKLVDLTWTGLVLDDALRELNDEQIYAAYPAFAFQSNSPTDNDRQIAIDRFRRALGGIRRLQKWNEFINLHWRALIAIHAMLLLALIAIIALTRWR